MEPVGRHLSASSCRVVGGTHDPSNENAVAIQRKSLYVFLLVRFPFLTVSANVSHVLRHSYWTIRLAIPQSCPRCSGFEDQVTTGLFAGYVHVRLLIQAAS